MKIGLFTLSGQLTGLIHSVTREESGLEVIWTARSAEEVVKLFSKAPVDVFIIAIDIPLSIAKQIVQEIHASSACKILIVARNLSSDTRFVFELMSAGASDRAIIPRDPSAEVLVEFIRKIRNLGSLNALRSASPIDTTLPTLIAIGASTGGPGIITSILEKLNEPLHAAVIIILHVALSFTEGMAAWMQKYTKIPLQIAREGDRPRENNIYLAATEVHLTLSKYGSFRYRDDPMQTFYHPSVDVFFHSIVEQRPPGMAVLLTGMGEDGAWGLLELRRAGWHTVAQDKETCIVYGMPKAAADIDAAVHIMPPDRIAREINVFASIKEYRRNHGNTPKCN